MLTDAIQAYKAVLREPELLDKENEILEAKRQELLKMARVIFPNENITFDTKLSQEKQIEQIAKIQARIDVYAYTNRKDLDEIRTRIVELNGLENKAENREELLKEIEDLKTKYKVFGRYVEDKDWEDLYMAKFEVLMSDINQRLESPLKNAQIDANELEYYKRIVKDKIKMGENPTLENSFGKERLAEGVRIIEGILKDDKNQFDAQEILQDKMKLRLIQAFSRPNGLEEITVNKDEINIRLDNDVFRWANVIPIKSLWQLTQEEYGFYLAEDANFEDDLFVKLYSLYNEHAKEREIEQQNNEEDKEFVKQKVHKIPEGITWIKNRDRSPYFDIPLLRKFRITNYDKIIFPSTLKGVEFGFINGTGVYEIEFNEGLEIIGDRAFEYCPNLGRYKNMKMPQSLKKIGKSAFCHCRNMAPLILNEGLEEIGERAFCNVYSNDVYSPANIIIIPSTVNRIGGHIVADYYVKNLGFKNYKGQDIPYELFENWYTPEQVVRERDAFTDHTRIIPESTTLENIYLFDGDSLEPSMRIDPKELFGNNKSDKLRKIVEKMKEQQKEQEQEQEK